MKKNLLVAVLILAVITSLTAGTLASYNLTLWATGTDAIKAIKFDFVARGDQKLNTQVKLNPGRSELYKVSVQNLSEVEVNFKCLASITSATTGFANVFSAQWYDENMAPLTNNAFTMGAADDNVARNVKIVYLKVKWVPQADATDVEFAKASAKATLTLGINGSYIDNGTGAASDGVPAVLLT